jgi:hypothetical protein
VSLRVYNPAMNKALLSVFAVLAVMFVSQMGRTWLLAAQENKAVGVAALVGCIGHARFLLACVVACTAAYFITARMA